MGERSVEVIKKGHKDWAELAGKTIRFVWTDGWDDYFVEMVFSHTRPYAEDPRYPRYYILSDNGGGYSAWEDEELCVTIVE